MCGGNQKNQRWRADAMDTGHRRLMFGPICLVCLFVSLYFKKGEVIYCTSRFHRYFPQSPSVHRTRISYIVTYVSSRVLVWECKSSAELPSSDRYRGGILLNHSIQCSSFIQPQAPASGSVEQCQCQCQSVSLSAPRLTERLAVWRLGEAD